MYYYLLFTTVVQVRGPDHEFICLTLVLCRTWMHVFLSIELERYASGHGSVPLACGQHQIRSMSKRQTTLQTVLCTVQLHNLHRGLFQSEKAYLVRITLHETHEHITTSSAQKV